MNQLKAPAGIRSASDPNRVLAAAFRSSDALLEWLPIGVFACDLDGALIDYNARAAEIWGRSPGIGAIEPDLCAAPMVEVLETGRPIRARQIELSRPDGAPLVVLADLDAVRDPSGEVTGAIGAFQDITATLRQAREAELIESLRRTSDVLQALPIAIYITDPDGNLTFYNDAAAEFWGLRPTVGQARWCGSWKLYAADGALLDHDQCPMARTLKDGMAIRNVEAVAEAPDGRRTPFRPYPTPLYDAQGRLIGAVNTLVDLSGEKAAEQRQRRLLDELDHRVKNSLAAVQSLAAGTGRNGDSLEGFRQAFGARLGALSKAHNLLTGRHWEGAGLRAVLDQALAAPGERREGRISLSGDDLELGPRTSLTLAMVLHELVDNAARHGAIPDGRIDIGWRLDVGPDEAPRLTLIWVESGGRPVIPPACRGFGLRLIERSLANELCGAASFNFAPGGLTCTLTMVLADEEQLE